MAKGRKRPVLWVTLALITVLTGVFIFNRGVRETTVLIAAIIWFDITKPNDPVTHTVRKGFETADYKNGDKIALTPKPLAAGVSKADVLKQLAAFKYTPDPKGTLSPAGDPPVKSGEDRLYYTLHTSEGVCDVFYEVELDFDVSGHLIQAWGTQTDQMCL